MDSKATLWIRNIGCLLTMDPKSGEGDWGLVRKAAVSVAGEAILWAGPEAKMPKDHRECETLDAGGGLVTPGLIDCHTHLVFAGDRSDEFFARLQGETYESIAKKGGGIAKTVAATRAASDEELVRLARHRLDQFLRFGVTTVEAKSGYGLSTEQELRLLRISGNLGHSVDVVPTFLGAHVVPPERRSDRNAHIREVVEEMLPRVKKEGLSGICDVFCEEGAFKIDEGRRILSRAKELGFQVKVHADQLTSNGGAELAAEFGALSADHLEQVSDRGIRALAKAGTVAVLIPGAVLFLGKRTYPPARKLLEAGIPVALSTDFNPGTSHTTNLPLIMTLAATELRMSAEEIWPAVTRNAARACGLADRGRVVPGTLADLAVWEAGSPSDVPYGFGSAFPRAAVRRGEVARL